MVQPDRSSRDRVSI